ncbi:MAG: hypothetical protein ABH803_01655 [Candidatus Micrarchaeota archaeon]
MKKVKAKKLIIKKTSKKAIQPPTPVELEPEKPKIPTSIIRPFVSEVAGKQGWQVVTAIGDGATDETIEKGTQIKMAEIRHVLNVLHNHGIVEYSRVKNMETGWFTYTWSVNTDRALGNYLLQKKREYEGLKAKLTSQEAASLYECKEGCCKLAFDEAFDSQFRCPTCTKKLYYTENKQELSDLETKIGSLQQILEGKNSKTQLI